MYECRQGRQIAYNKEGKEEVKKFIVACVAFLVILTLILIHSIHMVSFGKEIEELSRKTEKYAMEENWDEVLSSLKEITKKWEKQGIWSALTIKTDELEQIEISLKQSEQFAKLKDKSKFLGEFTMFSKLVEHIPHHEGFDIEEIL